MRGNAGCWTALLLGLVSLLIWLIPKGNIHSYEYTEGFKFL
jgi:hypothetical protein